MPRLSAKSSSGLRLCVGGWDLGIGDSGFSIAAGDEAIGLDLRLRPQKPPVLHGQGGLIDFGEVGWSYYYSQTRLAVEGRVTFEGVDRSVTGQAWFSLQLDDGRELMATALRDAEGGVSTTYGTLVGDAGAVTHLDASALRIQVLDRWRSPHSGANYPARWRLRVPAAGLDLDLTPTIPDQELDTRASTGTIYWEGSVEARQAGQPVGRGFVELTGYARTGDGPPPESAVRQNLCGPTSN